MNESAAVLAELGAETKTFRTVREALFWYLDRRAASLSVSAPMEPAHSPLNMEMLTKERATAAKIAYCLKSRDPEVDECELLHADKILEWNRGWTDPATLANAWGFGHLEIFSKMFQAERILRWRMMARGVLKSG